MEIKDLLRHIGVRNDLVYKPDIFSTLGIYRRNVWGFRPTIYSSTMTESSGESKVTVHWDVKRGKRGQESGSGGEPPSKRDQRTGDSLAMEVIKEMSRRVGRRREYSCHHFLH